MIDYVVDASVTAQYIVPDQLTAYADALFAQLGDTLKLHIPEFGLLECANIIWKQVRYGNLTTNEAETLLVDLAALPLIKEQRQGLSAFS